MVYIVHVSLEKRMKKLEPNGRHLSKNKCAHTPRNKSLNEAVSQTAIVTFARLSW